MKLINKYLKRLKALEKQERDFENFDTHDLGIMRLVAEQDRLVILASNRAEQDTLKEVIKDLEAQK